MNELLEMMVQYLPVSSNIYLAIWNTWRLQCHWK